MRSCILMLVLCHVAVAADKAEVVAKAFGIGFRYDGTGVYPHAKPPAEFDAQTGKHVRWKIPTPSWGYSQPVEVGGKVLVMVEPGPEDLLWPTLIAYDAKTGAESWRYEMDVFTGGALESRKSELLSAWRAFHDFYRQMYTLTAAYAHHYKDTAKRAELQSKIEALGLKPKRWTLFHGRLDTGHTCKKDNPGLKAAKHAMKKTPLVQVDWWGCGAARVGYAFNTPVSDGELVVAQTEMGTVVCIELQTGSLRWIKQTALAGQNMAGSPRIAEGKALVSFGGETHAYELATGELSWKYGTRKKMNHGLIASGAVMYLDGIGVHIDSAFRVLRISDGTALHPEPLVIPKYGSPVLDLDGQRFFSGGGSGERPKDWVGLRLSMKGGQFTKEQLWLRHPGFGSVSPVYYQNTIFRDGYALSPDDGWYIEGRGRYDGAFKNGSMSPPRKQDRGNTVPGSRHLMLVAAGKIYGLGNHYQKKGTPGPRFKKLAVFTPAGKKLAEHLIPDDTKNGYGKDPHVTRLHGVGANSSYAFPFSFGTDCIYVRDPAYLWCFGE